MKSLIFLQLILDTLGWQGGRVPKSVCRTRRQTEAQSKLARRTRRGFQKPEHLKQLQLRIGFLSMTPNILPYHLGSYLVSHGAHDVPILPQLPTP